MQARAPSMQVAPGYAQYGQLPPAKANKKKSGSSSLGTCLAACAGVVCSCLCCGLAIAVIVLLIMLGPKGWWILGGCILIFFVVLIGGFLLHQMVVEGYTFHLFNYYLPMFQYGITSQLYGEKGVKDFWQGKAYKTGVATGIGPVTETVFGWQQCAAMLSSWGQMLANGTMKRANELGLAIMSSAVFPETKEVLPTDRNDHALVRPYIAGACDGSRKQEGVPCNNINGWNRASLRQFWRDRFASIDSFNTNDTLWMYTILLHRVMLSWDMSDDEAQDYMRFPSCLSFPGAGKMGVALSNLTERELCLFRYCLPFPCAIPAYNAKMNDHLDQIKEMLVAKWPGHSWDDDKLAQAGNIFQTGFMWAGGLSVPTILQNMLAWWFATEDRPAELSRVRADDEASIKDFMWETMRRNPPVAGVPRWVTADRGETWTHEVANVEQAMQDESMFPDSMTFKMGRPGLNAKDSSLSLFFADPTIVNNDTCHPDSHICPGKNLALESMVAFWQEFLLYNWSTDCSSIKVGYNVTTTFEVYRD